MEKVAAHSPVALPRVVIVGRPNVGKSTLMNRIAGRREAIVEELPGVTRDRKEIQVEWQGREFLLIDTGGWLSEGTEMDKKVSAQSEFAAKNADMLLFVVDTTVGVTQEDSELANFLHRKNLAGDRMGGKTSAKPDTQATAKLNTSFSMLIANKADTQRHDNLAWEFMSLGFGDPWPLSALHGRGTADVLDHVVATLFAGAADEQNLAPENLTTENLSPQNLAPEKLISVAIVGRPNVGKSTLFNRLVKQDRSVVHDQPGTTRDSVDTIAETEIGKIRFVDTAGLRRKSRIDEQTEQYAALRALNSIDKADVVLLVIDATAGLTHQDMRLAERVDASGCGVLVLVNKWDAVNTEQRSKVLEDIQRRLGFVGDGSVLRITALSGRGTHKILPELTAVVADYQKRIPTRQVNKTIRLAQSAHQAPGGARVLYATQAATDPPTFLLFSNRRLPQTYIRYLERRLREEFKFGAAPLRMRVKVRSE